MIRWLLVFLAGLLPGYALANDRDLRATSVPASSCIPYFAENAEAPGQSLPWFNSFYGLEGAYPNPDHRIVYLHCPLSVNNIELSTKSNDNDISSFRVAYRDADGLGMAAWVEVYLYQLVVLASGEPRIWLICHWNSRENGSTTTGFTKVDVLCAHDILPGAFYTFEARLFTRFVGGPTPPTPAAAFAGITFP